MTIDAKASFRTGGRSYTTDLVHLLAGICHVPSALNTVIHGLQMDSRKIRKGDLFLALSGSHSASTDHIVEAIERGANAVVAEGKVFKGRVFEDGDAIELFVDDLKLYVGGIADRFFQSPSKDLSVVGVTGTNGKTSVTNYLAKYFSLSGIKSGFIGTLGYGLPDEDVFSTEHTTPNVVDVHRYLAELRALQVKFVAMEVSSHGLSQGRTDGVSFEGAVFTNLSREHLDYHGTMDSYAEAKSDLFKSGGLSFAIINNDDVYAKKMSAVLAKDVMLIRYGIENPSDITATACEFNAGIHSEVDTPLGAISIESQLIGRFNLSNLLAVIGVAVAKGHELQNLSAIKRIGSVVGRMEVVKVSGQATAVVDYAHTPDALKSALEALRPHCLGKMRVVFGCGGDRDTGKRSEMAAIAESMADDVIVTDDNPRYEDPEKIVNDILAGFKSLKNVTVLHSRAEAISVALGKSDDSDVVLVAGKGHETWQEIKGERTFFSDISEVNQNLNIPEKSMEESGGD